jgi:serine/threonine protein kinase
MKCPKCHSDNPDTQSFCGGCGTQLGPPKDIPMLTKTLTKPFSQLAPGTSLANRYEVIKELGKGGMGEVYLAEDTNLTRKVAIKILPQQFALDQERLARFGREARLLASLSHPNIATIYGLEKSDDLQFLVMEMIEGNTLEDLIKKGPLPVDEILEVFRQIAEGLESAHAKGIIHRDLKPSNIKVTPEGKVKILDFGLAKVFTGKSTDVDIEKSPTITDQMTEPGVVLGTAAYMSPEQARGKEADSRSDIWSFGVLLWEVLTGKHLFDGESVSDTLAAVLRADIDGAALPEDTPAIVRALLKRCLVREPRLRLRDIGEARIALEALSLDDQEVTLLGTPESTSVKGLVSRRMSMLPWLAAGLAVATAALLGGLYFRQKIAEPSVVWSSLSIPSNVRADFENGIAFSPDGSKIAFTVINQNGLQQLWVRELSSPVGHLLSGTEGCRYPFWSPDGRHIGFFASARLKRIPAEGGQTQTLATAPDARGGAWGPDKRIVYAPYFQDGLYIINENGGKPQVLTEIALGEVNHRFPVFLPDGKNLLFLVLLDETHEESDDGRIEILNLDSRERKSLISISSSMAYSKSGHLLYWRDGDLVAHPFDFGNLALTGNPITVAENVSYSSLEYAVFSAGPDLLVFQQGIRIRRPSRLKVTDRVGHTVGESTPEREYKGFAVSNDGLRVAYDYQGAIWILDLIRGTSSRLTVENGYNWGPLWSPDDRWVAYTTDRNKPHETMRRLSSGLGSEEVLMGSQNKAKATDWSADGRFLLFEYLNPETDWDIALYDLTEKELRFLVQTPWIESSPSFSPDDKWVLYASTESGRWEIYVIPLKGSGEKYRISTSGGLCPEWSPKGDEIFYFSLLGQLMAVEVTREEKLEFGLPQELFSIDHPIDGLAPFGIMPDGKHFLVKRFANAERTPPLYLVQNWTQLLDKN